MTHTKSLIYQNICYWDFNDFLYIAVIKGEVIKEYFYNYEILSNDFTIELGSKNVKIYPKYSEIG